MKKIAEEPTELFNASVALRKLAPAFEFLCGQAQPRLTVCASERTGKMVISQCTAKITLLSICVQRAAWEPKLCISLDPSCCESPSWPQAPHMKWVPDQEVLGADSSPALLLPSDSSATYASQQCLEENWPRHSQGGAAKRTLPLPSAPSSASRSRVPSCQNNSSKTKADATSWNHGWQDAWRMTSFL